MSGQTGERFVPRMPAPESDGVPALDGWGFEDSGLQVTADGHVTMAGSRYPLSGAVLPNLVPWISKILEVEVDPFEDHRSQYPPHVPEPVRKESFVADLRSVLPAERIVDRPEVRLRHGHGHTQEEIWAIRYGRIERVPDLVVYPESDQEAEQLVRAAAAHDAVLVPYGGGTNVSEALRCPTGEARMIVSVDMTRMNRIRWIDPRNYTACIEAGAMGRHITAVLEAHGFTMGHEPDSIELSTLGGWIATNAGGMKKNRYGNIGEIVQDVTAVTPEGKLERFCVGPRESVGLDPRRLLFGSEGNIALITSAVVTLFPAPEEQRFDSVLFHSFEEGVDFMYELTRSGSLPASVRLVDNMQFQFSQALKPASQGLAKLKSKLQKAIVTGLKRFRPDRMVALTLVYEGTKPEVREQQQRVHRIARRFHGLPAGAENGRRGYAMTFAIAYIRDFVMSHYILGESFETSVSWSDLTGLCARVKRRVREEHAARNLPGRPFITCRVTQIYQTGVCVYFYLAFSYKGVESPSAQFAEIERAARDEILSAGGSLSHHHGIGKIRDRFVERVHSPESRRVISEITSALDPSSVFGIANHGVRGDHPPESRPEHQTSGER